MDISFNFETRTVTLNSGYDMPIYGIGAYSLLDEVCVNSVSAARESGVRLIDTEYIDLMPLHHPGRGDMEAYHALERAVADGKKGVVAIPGSSNPDHIRENTELFDFELTFDEMERINALDRNEKHGWY